MTYEKYWYGDPLMVRAFYKAEKVRQERADADAWLHGLYVARAVESTICNAFLPKGKLPQQYPKMPYLLEEKQKREEEARRTAEQERAFAQLYMMQMMESLSGRFRK